MRVARSVRLNKLLDEKLEDKAKELNITRSQIIELACSEFIKENKLINNTDKIINRAKEKNFNHIKVNLYLDNNSFGKLINIINTKNSTLSQEILYRLSASLNNPVFEQFEFEELFKTRTNLNQIGNLIKLSLDNKLPYDNDLMINAEKSVFKLRDEINKLLELSNERTFKGAIRNAKYRRS